MKQSRKPKGLPRCRRGAKRAFRELRSGWCSFFRLTTKNQTYIIYKRNRAVNRLTVNSPIFFVSTPIRGWFWDLLHRRNYVTYWYVGKSISFLNLFPKIWLQDSYPVLVAFSEQMQAIVGIIRVHVLGSRSHELREEVDVGPVSYTHLDVYKRQV